jgi:hypothetical protein
VPVAIEHSAFYCAAIGEVDDLGGGERLALRSLVDRYARCFDLGDRAGFDRLWTDDGSMDVHEDGPSAPPTGRLSVGRFHLAFDALERYDRTLHHVTTHDARIDGHEAEGLTGCVAHHLTVGSGREADDLRMHIRYTDRYRRVEAGWRFVHRRVDVLFRERATVELLP